MQNNANMLISQMDQPQKLKETIERHREKIISSTSQKHIVDFFNVRSPQKDLEFNKEIWSGTLTPELYSILYGKIIDYCPFTASTNKSIDPMSDATVTKCCNDNCTITFNFLNRKGHCRCCGKIFCSTCLNNVVSDVPIELIMYTNIKDWISTHNKVCDECNFSITKFNEVRTIIRYLKVVNHKISSCLKLATLSEAWFSAVRHYLSKGYSIQHYLPNVKLTEDDIKFLDQNVDTLVYHNKWLMQYLKISVKYYKISTERDDSLDFLTSQSKECSISFCPGCNGDLTAHDALAIINSSSYNKEVKKKALKILEKEESIPYYITIFLPTEVPIVQEFILKQPDIFDDVFWYTLAPEGTINTVFKNNLTAMYHEKYQSFMPFNEFILTLQKFPNEMDETQITGELIKIPTPFKGPFGMIDQIEENTKIFNSKNRPLKISYMSEKTMKSLLYKQEDVRKDAYAMSLINLMYFLCRDLFVDAKDAFLKPIKKTDKQIDYVDSFKESSLGRGFPFPGTPCSSPQDFDSFMDDESKASNKSFGSDTNKEYLVNYRIIPITSSSGLIEMVDDAKTLTEIKKDYGNITDYIFSSNSPGNVKDIRAAFSVSTAYWTVVSYILGICDRHTDNIMVRSDGCLFHIDYGYLLNEDKLMPLMRLDDMIVGGLGPKDVFSSFKDKCIKIFIRLRENAPLITTCILRMSNLSPKITDVNFSSDKIEAFISKRFMLGCSVVDAINGFSNLLDASRNSKGSMITDIAHSTVNNSISGTYQNIKSIAGVFANFFS